MKSSKEIISSGRFRPNRLMKAQLMEDQQAASEGKLGLTQAQKEQMAQEGAAAAAAQAAQTQTEISRSMMGQPDFVGQKAQLSAAATEAALVKLRKAEDKFDTVAALKLTSPAHLLASGERA